jgi:CubicO group peptidase (beta-lactamase class C family)
VTGLAGTVGPALPAAAVIAAVAADEGGYAVKLSDDCPLDGRFEIGSMTKTMTGAVLASLVNERTASGLPQAVRRLLDRDPGN